jgi:hypothetical protein
MSIFRKYILPNAGLKLLALGISFFLWAAYAPQPLAEIGYDVPIAFINVPRNLTLSSNAPTAVHLLIRGRAALMRQINPTDLTFTVDLGRVAPGETMVRLAPEMAAVPFGTNVVGVAPATLRVSWVADPTALPK